MATTRRPRRRRRRARPPAAPPASPTTQIGIVGFCFGGRVTFLVALRRALGAAVGFYGGGIVTARFPQFPPLVDEAASLQTPWLGLFGDQDASIPVDDVEQLRAALARGAGRHRDRALRRRRARLPLRRARRLPRRRRGRRVAAHPRLVRQVPLGAGTPFSHPFPLSPASRCCRGRAPCARPLTGTSPSPSSSASSSWSSSRGRRRDVVRQRRAHFGDRVVDCDRERSSLTSPCASELLDPRVDPSSNSGVRVLAVRHRRAPRR